MIVTSAVFQVIINPTFMDAYHIHIRGSGEELEIDNIWWYFVLQVIIILPFMAAAGWLMRSVTMATF